MEKFTFQRILLPSPILSLVENGQGGVWAGGTGGVAQFQPMRGWTPLISGLPLTGVSALATSPDWLFAGGVEGLARFSYSDSIWQLCHIEGGGKSFACLALSPDFANDQSVLAGSLTGGVFRTQDAGKTWHASNFGLLNFEVTALAWAANGQVFAGTANGIYRSPNGGRAWRAVDATIGIGIAALVIVSDSQMLAFTDDGQVLSSADGANWTKQDTDIAADTVPTVGYAHGDSIWLGSSNKGLLRSSDGVHWQSLMPDPILSIAASGDRLYVGTGKGLSASADGGQTWNAMILSPLHDLRRIHVVQGRVIVSGGYSVTLRAQDQLWEALTQTPIPLSMLYADRNGRLFASGVDGLFLSEDAGGTWTAILAGQPGYLAHMAIRDDGTGWAISADSARILRTIDGGLNWETAASPLGVDQVVALEAAPDLVFAATYNPNQQTVRLWHSPDGTTWRRGAEAQTVWSIVATSNQPPMISLGGTILVQQADSTWQKAAMPNGASFVRRIVGRDALILALTTNGVLISRDHGGSFTPLDGIDLPADQMMDIALDGDRLYVLSVDGLVCAFNLIP